MKPASRVLSFALLASFLCAPGTVARADDGTPARAAADVARAKDLFEEGIRLRNAGDLERALERFRASRALHAGGGNTRNMAYCFGELDRWDEALEMYEDLLARFGAELDTETQDKVARYMTLYRRRVGALDVSANVDGQILVDGRLRGRLPLTGPLRLLPGSHLIRIVKGGYMSYEKTVTVVVGQTTALDAVLGPLRNVGTLRVDVDPRGELAHQGTLTVDGSPVGALPWEGNLAPGPHVLFASAGDDGSDIVRAVVVEGQIVSTTLVARKLGAPVRIRVEPPTARVSIDGVTVGRGGFEGRLALGDHEVAVTEEGYTSAHFTLRSTGESGQARGVALAVDAKHPRWRRVYVVRPEVDAAALLANSLGSGPEERARGGLATGGLVAGRLGVELPIRLALDLSGGWLRLTRGVTRSIDASFSAAGQAVPVRYAVQDTLQVAGPFVGLGVRQQIPFGRDRFDLRLGLGLALGAFSSRDLSATAASSAGLSAGLSAATMTTLNGAPPPRTWVAFMTPEIEARYRLGPVELGVGLGAVAFLTGGPAIPHGETRIQGGGCPHTLPSDVRCAPGVVLPAGDAFGRLVAWAPRLSLGWPFF